MQSSSQPSLALRSFFVLREGGQQRYLFTHLGGGPELSGVQGPVIWPFPSVEAISLVL